MKLVSYIYNDAPAVGVLTQDETRVVPVKALGYKADDMNALIDELHGQKLRLGEAESIALSDVELDAAIDPRQDVICLGLNYREHAAEATRADKVFDVQKGDAVYFAKRVDRAVAPGKPIEGHFDICDSLDYEVELTVIIGKDAKNVSAADAAEYIFGYSVINDVSARNLQTRHKQWYFGKSLDGFTPIGPCILTGEQFLGRPKLGIRSYVNGQKRQDSSTDMMIFDIPYIIEELSAGMTLRAGTVIATGTPSGVALGMPPETRKYLVSGDVVRCEIDQIGVLENEVR